MKRRVLAYLLIIALLVTLIGCGSNTTSTSEKNFVGSSDSNKYHYPSCKWAQKISPSNEVWFATPQDAQAKGYVVNIPRLNRHVKRTIPDSFAV